MTISPRYLLPQLPPGLEGLEELALDLRWSSGHAADEVWQNGYAERLIRTIKEEKVDLSEYLDYYDAYHQIGHFLEDVSMRKRIHSSLGYLTPLEFEANWWAEHDPIKVVH